ncbi:MAG TPA: GNAT family N-acetyltransferase [Candidatus Babeliales bacterium]|jgi:RimJ/RimL family protein N-acetyltransferase|nr:GNAT family N-acetyltransferase [Candidatus Babeliales bacterium]
MWKSLKGYGTLFIKQFINELTKIEPWVTTVIVDPDPENVAAIRCYEKVGFIRVSVFDVLGDKHLLMRYDINCTNQPAREIS